MTCVANPDVLGTSLRSYGSNSLVVSIGGHEEEKKNRKKTYEIFFRGHRAVGAMTPCVWAWHAFFTRVLNSQIQHHSAGWTNWACGSWAFSAMDHRLGASQGRLGLMIVIGEQ